jgi:two-component system sensor histidine kinase KdpD
MISECVKSALAVLALTLAMFLIGRDVLGEAVIGLLYLLPVGWSTTRWGHGPGMCAAVIAFLCFNFFFIPPFFTFTVGSLEGWLVLIIFLIVAVVYVGRIQYGLSRAQAREREAIFMYELSTALAGQHTQAAVARTLAGQLRQLYQARMVQVAVQTETPPLVITTPPEAAASARPDRILPIMAARGLVGEIHLWHGELPLPAEDDRLLRNFATQGALALERARLAQAEAHPANNRAKV